MCPNTCFSCSCTICSLSKYDIKCELDCFNCKTGGFLRLFTSMFIKKLSTSNHLFAIDLTNINNYKEKPSVSSVHNTIMHQFSQTLANSKIYPSELLSVDHQTNIVSKHNTEIVNHLQIVKDTL